MEQYRVVRACGEAAEGARFAELRDAQEWVDIVNRGPSYPEFVPYRVQRMVWEDVPLPEALPDLPDTVWLSVGIPGSEVLTRYKQTPDSLRGYRVFRGTVSAWEEVP